MWIFRLEGRLGNYDGGGNENAKNRSEKNFVFSFYDIRMKFRTRTRIWIGKRIDLYGNANVVSVPCKQI